MLRARDNVAKRHRSCVSGSQEMGVVGNMRGLGLTCVHHAFDHEAAVFEFGGPIGMRLVVSGRGCNIGTQLECVQLCQD